MKKIIIGYYILLSVCLVFGTLGIFFYAHDLRAENTVESLLPITKEIKSVSLMVVGDMMLDRNVNKKTLQAKDYNHPFNKLIWPEVDFRIGNLEGPVTNFKSVVTPANLSFTFSPNFLKPLKNNFEVLGLANNHTLNFGKKGLEQTRNFLASSSIYYFGDPSNNENYISYVIEKNGLKIGLVGFNELTKSGYDQVVSRIKQLKDQVDFLIVFPHWGIEYDTKKPSLRQKQEGHAFIDAGASLVIGTHPHVIQPIEEYNGKYIFYSLGNFIFDQYFSKETMQGLGVQINLVKDNDLQVKYTLHPVQINNQSQPYFLDALGAGKILTALAKVSFGSETLKVNIVKGSW